MHRRVRLVVVTALTLAAGAGAVRLKGTVADLELFRVRQVRVEGARYLAHAEAVAAAAIPADASVWDDPAPWEGRLEGHPLVKRADARRRPPGTVVLRVEERTPVALLPTPTLEPVDGEGVVLPVDPALHRLDLPVVHPRRAGAGEAGAGPGGFADVSLRILAGELARLAEVDPDFTREVSVLSAEGPGALEALWGDAGVRLLFHAPLTPERLREARAALEDAGARFPERRARAVDLRYADQVVVRFAGDDQ